LTSGPDHDHGHSHGQPADDLAGAILDQAFWDERYQSSSALWSGRPNPQLVTEAAGLPAGTALDVGCGEGADAIWLAGHGWQVTAVDISAVALQRAAAQALRVGADAARRITWQHADLGRWIPAAASFDLVSAQFVHLPKAQRELIFRQVAESVAPGGTLLIVGHHPSDLQTTVPRPPLPELFYGAADVAAALAPQEWTILVQEARPRIAQDPDGRSVTVHDSVLRAQRSAAGSP
jgi:SAM-dependent methyltransferase